MVRTKANGTEVEAVLARLRTTAARFEPWRRPEFTPALRGAASRLEHALGRALADDVRTFLRACDAVKAMNIGNGYWIGGTRDLIRAMTRFDSPVPNPGAAERAAALMSTGLIGGAPQAIGAPDPRALEVAGERVPAVFFGTDGGGNMFYLGAAGGGPAWLRDHETGAVREVAPSLCGLLARIGDDWERCLAGAGGRSP